MENKNKKRNIIIAVSILLVIIIAVVLVLILKKDDAYRIIKVYEYEGAGLVSRDSIGDIEPYNNMVLESGDKVTLNTGDMTLKLDDDKYIYVEENTKFVLEATGTSEDSKTRIELLEGAITNDIQNKLSDESSYEINTPNSTMAVRGTTYRVTTYYDEEGVCYTKLSVFDGEVTTRLIHPDGRVSEEEVSVAKGKEVIIYEDGKVTDYLGDVTDINYDELSDQVTQTLIDLGYDITSSKHTVTFMYNGTEFGTQTVKHGECAQMPTLVPSQTGKWDFDFDTPINQDTTIEWK